MTAPVRDTGSRLSRVVLAPGREGPVRGRHPWIFSGAVKEVRGEVRDGDEGEVTDGGGTFLARGLFNSRSQIRVRCYAWEPGEQVD
ncbi:MAG TPA: hypothetical protein VLA43_18850, partial [Longimicrobiales bacterium]|nr:hypothetical protein [Longimicrobiales bacterium]